MAKFGKKYQDAAKLVEAGKAYDLAEAIEVVKKTATAKFDESVDVAVRLGVNPKYADQQVRGAVVLPHGTGKSKEGWWDFDVRVATPDMMGVVGRLGKILGPRGLMPNPKLGTVTMDLTKAVNEIKAGKVEYRTDKAGNVHVPIGKVSFDNVKLVENLQVLLDTLVKVKPAAAKGQYMRNITVSTTMGPAVTVNTNFKAAKAE